MELAVQLRRDMKPQLDKLGIKLILVSIGTFERSQIFAQKTGFPSSNLFVDPESVTYEALGCYKSIAATFLNPLTPINLAQRVLTGRMGDLQDVLKDWDPWTPPKADQALQQGGLFIFEGEQCTFAHFDQATGAHVAMDKVMEEVNKLVSDRKSARL